MKLDEFLKLLRGSPKDAEVMFLSKYGDPMMPVARKPDTANVSGVSLVIVYMAGFDHPDPE